MSADFDVIIIGASLSGASTAAVLGKAGFRVALCDREIFPRHKTCAEGFSRLGLEVLYKLGLESKIKSCPHHEFQGYRIQHGSRQVDLASPANEEVTGIGIRRFYLDKVVLDAAVETGSIDLLQGSQVREVAPGKNVRVSVGKTNVHAPYVVLADGGNSFLSSKLQIPMKREPRDLYGLRFILEGARPHPLTQVCIFARDGYEIYCTPVAEHLLNVAILTRRAKVAALLDQVNFSRTLHELLDNFEWQAEVAEAPKVTGPLGRVSRRCHWNNLLLVGDSCETLDPLGGMGMTHAVLSGTLAGKALCHVLQESKNIQEAFQLYAREREAAMRPLRGFTRLSSGILRTQIGGRALGLVNKTGLFSAVEDALSAELKSPLGYFSMFLLSMIGSV